MLATRHRSHKFPQVNETLKSYLNASRRAGTFLVGLVSCTVETEFGAYFVQPKAVRSAATGRHPLQLRRAGVDILSENSIHFDLRKFLKKSTNLTRGRKLSASPAHLG